MPGLSERTLLKSVAVLASGTAAGQLILLLSAPILTRLYSPDEFGLLGAYMAPVGIFGAVATLRYEGAIPLPGSDRIAANVLLLSMACVVVVAVVSTAVLVTWGDGLARLFGVPALASMGWLIPLGVLGVGLYSALSHWAVRQRNFGTIARTKLIQSGGQTAVQLLAAFTPFAVFGLLFGHVLGQAAGIGSFLRGLLGADRDALASVSLRRIRLVALRYWKFPAYAVWSSATYAAILHAPILVLLYLFDPGTAGLFLLAHRVGLTPVTLLRMAINQSIFRDLAEARAQRVVGQTVIGPIQTMLRLVVAPAIFGAVIAPHAAAAIFGPDWYEAGRYLRWMTPWLAVVLIFGPMAPIIAVMEWQRLSLIFHVSSLLVGLVGMISVGLLSGPVASVAVFSGLQALCIVIYRLLLLHLLKISLAGLVRLIIAQVMLFSAIFAMAAWLFTSSAIEDSIRWSASAILMTIAVGAYLVLNLRPYLPQRGIL